MPLAFLTLTGQGAEKVFTDEHQYHVFPHVQPASTDANGNPVKFVEQSLENMTGMEIGQDKREGVIAIIPP